MVPNYLKYKMMVVLLSEYNTTGLVSGILIVILCTPSLMRDYFSSLGEPANSDSHDPRVRAITNFQELLLVSFREFSVITEETIAAERKRFRTEIVSGIESFTKRAAVRNLKTLGRLNKEQAGMIYDILFQAICDEPPNDTRGVPNDPDEFKDPTGRPETRIGLKTFRVFLSQIASWARDETIVSNGFQVGVISLPPICSSEVLSATHKSYCGRPRSD